MSKLKSPFLSLGARGTVGNVLTAQERPGQKFVRKKPIPAYRYTLKQAYQRWLYEDYAYLWTQQTAATQREWHSKASRRHMPGFALWMSYYLKNLPDIAGWWKLDFYDGTKAPDSSKNANNGIVFGSVLTDGLISYAGYFDGIDDWINCGNDPSLQLLDDFTLELIHRPPFLGAASDGAGKMKLAPNRDGFCIFKQNDNKFYFFLTRTPVWTLLPSDIAYPDLNYHHLTGRRKAGLNELFIDGQKQAASDNFVPSDSTKPFVIGRLYSDWPPYDGGDIDNVILYNRPLDDTEILRHSQRRYPV